METADTLQPLTDTLRHLSHPNGPIVSLLLVGSRANSSPTIRSDIDLVLVLSDEIASNALVELGECLRDGLSRSFVHSSFMVFQHPFHDRPELFAPSTVRCHVIEQSESVMMKSIETANWIHMCWSRAYRVLLGLDVFSKAPSAELNMSLLDQLDGIPALIRECDSAIILYNPLDAEQYLNKLCRYTLNRIADIGSTFVELGWKSPQLPHSLPVQERILQLRDNLIELRKRVARLVL